MHDTEIEILALNEKTSRQLRSELTLLGYSILVGASVRELVSRPVDTEPYPIPTVVVGNFERTRSAFDTVRELALDHRRVVIVVSTAIGEGDRLNLLRIGVSGIIDQAFSIREIALRIAGILHAAASELSVAERNTEVRRSWRLHGSTLTIDDDAHKVFLDGAALRVTETEWKVLRYLAYRAEKNCARDAIVQECMGYEYTTSYLRSLDAHVKNIRKKLACPEWIETIRGYGYQFGGVPVSSPATLSTAS